MIRLWPSTVADLEFGQGEGLEICEISQPSSMENILY